MDVVLESVQRVLGSNDAIRPPPSEAQERQVLDSGANLISQLQHQEARKQQDAALKRASQGLPITFAKAAESNIMSVSECDQLIDLEMARRAKSVQWRSMDMFLRWRLVSSYISKLNLANEGRDELAELRRLIQTNQLKNVEYDIATQSILRLNHKGM